MLEEGRDVGKWIRILNKTFANIIINQVYFEEGCYEEKYCPIEEKLSNITFNIITFSVNNAWYEMENTTINNCI